MPGYLVHVIRIHVAGGIRLDWPLAVIWGQENTMETGYECCD